MLSKIAVAVAVAGLALSSPGAFAAGHHRGPVIPPVTEAAMTHVRDLIIAQAPAHGVPTDFALKIAKAESRFNPGVTGAEGEIGVFQLKCSTAHGIGYTGSCAALYDPALNVKWGLTYLSMAVKSAHGNLALAASKHNGGLNTTHLRRRYLALVF